MQRIIIFDFNRTLFDPEAQKLLPGAPEVLGMLKAAGFSLFLISRIENGRRARIKELGLLPFFAKVLLTEQKTEQGFRELIPADTDFKNSFVIGDRIREEIKIGNQLGLQTIWLKNGKFANELPQNSQENPTWTISALHYAWYVILRASS